MLRLVCLVCLVACSEGFDVADEDAGPDASLDSTVVDATNQSDAEATDAGPVPADAGPLVDASSDAGGNFTDPDCPTPWLFFADPTRATIRRISLVNDPECAELDGGGALDEEVTSVTIAEGVFVVASPGQLQGLDLRTNSVVWSMPQEQEDLDSRTVVVPLTEGFIAAWTSEGLLVEAIQVIDPTMGTSRPLPIDEYYYDLSAASDLTSFWAARDPGERSRRDLSGARVEARRTVTGLKRIHVLGSRIASVEGRSSRVHVDDLNTGEDVVPEQVDPDDCGWIPFALPDPMNDDEYIVACTRVGGPLGEVGSLRVTNSSGTSRSLLVVNSVIWDAELYVPTSGL